MKQRNFFTWKIGGEAGQGQQIAGLILGRTCLSANLFSFIYSEYPSRLRGGLVTNQVSISNKPIEAVSKKIDFLFALSQPALDHCIKDLNNNALVFYDSDKVKEVDKNFKKIKFIPLSLHDLAKENNINAFMLNSLILGISAVLFDFDIKLLKKEIRGVLSDNNKPEDLIKNNNRAVQIGYEYACKELKLKPFFKNKSNLKSSKRIILTGNEAVAMGSVSSKCGFYSAYPMTPASSILHILAKQAKENKMIVNHSEDEIAAINMAIGASWAGKRSMIGTSGGGFALMSEGLNLSAMSETPLVIVNSQRPGPATGMATWTEQGDLQYLAKVGYGDFHRIILAPADPEESFYFTILAFNFADIYQMPVFLLLDKYISESYKIIPDFNLSNIKINRGKLLTEKQLAKIKNYKRYAFIKDGVSPRSLPGQKNGIFLANGNEHDEYGFSIDGFNSDLRNKQMEKRHAKIKDIFKELPKPKLFGPSNALITLIGWGSVKGPVLEALKTLNQNNSRVNYVHIPAPFPLDGNSLSELLKNIKKTIVIENNYKGQMADLMQEVLGMKFEHRLNKYNGQQFFPEEIIKLVKKEF
ncbi:2-oxoacid:acceptor oxidoreductase subunit alpha [Patescibacteria group bacterium]|nr:2-oxoacid:acceptor oxidoreductase subunit alpha [Patescibacteria group bacterium]MBU2472856.1 2-oxoacid:acceptor oxidoreductase subunit alpha [Patescibacteria group bacterium]